MKNFLKYFFCTENRITVSIIVILALIYTIFVSNWITLLTFLFNVILIIIGAFVALSIELIVYIICCAIWLKDTESEIDSTANFISTDLLKGLFIANFFALMFLYYKGTITWG